MKCIVFSQLLLACVLGISADRRPAHAQVTPSPTTRLSASDRLRQELLQQRAAWQELERTEHLPIRPPYIQEPIIARAAHAGCTSGAFYPNYQDEVTNRAYARPSAIPSATATFGACPWWIPPKVRGRSGRSHEYAGKNPTPAQLVPFSELLISELSTLAQQEETAIWPVSQLVRVLTENDQVARARSALNGCRVSETWCTLLRVYVEQGAGAYHLADSMVRSLVRHAPAEVGRGLLDVSRLLGQDDVLQNGLLRSDSVTTQLWWLAQPFFSDSANARRSEHVARLVRNTLARQIELDAFYHTYPNGGGDAIQLMRQKYGWPTHQAWVGASEDERIARVYKVTPPPPYSAPEYSWPRTATIPRVSAALAPHFVTDSDFNLGPADSVSYFQWWPAEFFQHKDGLIVPFASQQRVLLRRDTSMLVFIATTVQGSTKPSPFDSIGDAPVRGELWFSPAPDSAVRLFQTLVKGGDRLVLHGDVRQPGIVGAEFRVNASGLAGGRSRFGVADVRTLASLPPGTCELSVPMLVDASALSANSVGSLEAILLGSLTLSNPASLGVAWESYGFAPGDTTTIAVHIERNVETSGLQRAGIALGIIQDPNVSAGLRWTEPNPSRSSVTLGTRVPVTQRHLTIGVKSLKAGEYVLHVEVENARCGAVRSEQVITITR